jgi:hypothetical protein
MYRVQVPQCLQLTKNDETGQGKSSSETAETKCHEVHASQYAAYANQAELRSNTPAICIYYRQQCC